jgi:hypothetical protein
MNGRAYAVLALQPREDGSDGSSGKLVYSKSGMVYEKRYLDESKGVSVQDWWDDISMLRGIKDTGERLGYPTQKPEALLERIVKTGSDEGDVVLDPFCGCGTAIAVAQKLNRRWIGIDITHLAVNLIKKRLRDHFGEEVRTTYNIVGEPVSLKDATELAKQDPFQFQAWALGLVGARVATSSKKGADEGIDGRLFFHDDKSGKSKQVILSVKAGENVNVSQVRDLRGVLDREKADIGVLISMESPSKPMVKEAAEAGFYKSPQRDGVANRVNIDFQLGLSLGQCCGGSHSGDMVLHMTTFVLELSGQDRRRGDPRAGQEVSRTSPLKGTGATSTS